MTNSSFPATLLITGSVLLALAVMLGAFGAHVAAGALTPERLDVYRTAVEYHFYHSLGLLVLGAVTLHTGINSLLRWSGVLLMAGVMLFSGSLYLLVLTDAGWLGAVTPFGGVSFVIAWILFAAGLFRTGI